MPDLRYDFGAGRSDPATFPTEALKRAAVAAIDANAEILTTYPGNLGFEPLRVAMARRESTRDGVPVDPDHIALTNGSMQAVTLCGQALIENRGDPVIMEEYSYPGTIAAYRSIGYDMVGIDVDEHGMRMDVLADRLAELDAAGRPPKFIYALTTYQNPTGTVMPKARRLELIELGRRYGVPIVEDNCYADVHYEGDVEPSIYALDDDPRHINLGSLSKILGPGLRLGYLHARPPMLNRILAHRHDAGPNILSAAIAAEFYKDGIWDHAAQTNPVLKEKRDLVFDGLATELDGLCAFSRPIGGLFIWVRLPDDVDRRKLAQISEERGLKYLPGQSFHVRGEDTPHLRLAFGHVPNDLIVEGIQVLAGCVRAARTSNEAVHLTSAF